MSAAAIAFLERALKADDIDSMRFEIMSALGSLKQQPDVLHELDVHKRLEKAVRKFDSAAAAAKAWGVPKQTLHSVRQGDIPCPPKLQSVLGVRRLTAGRTLYQEV